ncbi:hypothetical protein HG536_0C03010 [Torulaspora globosa]|uniref:Sterol regulatory element-binding protein cleavage-activating protein n=1 Tax=Torulaspora globosa TaxID=48254 RepID=A0A7G3ZF47_9SACH|nr:uncharacterized protein HG536_0C03010 [Torulaspora globosa]QLL32133.1 hypothetical protein HG536_0C03010 [Torulaspora globosa]
MRNPDRRKNYKAKFGLVLRDRLCAWIAKVVRRPQINIVLPLLILSSFSYHTLSNLTITWPTSGYLSRVEAWDGESVGVEGLQTRNLTMIPILVRSIDENHNILEKRSLLEYMAFQNKLIDGFPQDVALNSFFRIWDHSLDILYQDKVPLQTINAKHILIPPYSLLETWKVNGLISSAAGCLISLFTDGSDLPEVQRLLQENIARLNSISNVTTFHILEPRQANSTSKFEALQRFRVFVIRIGKNWNIALSLVYLSLCLHFFLSMKMLRNSVRSVIGMSVAMIAQLTLVIASSITVTELLFKGSDDIIPTRLLCWPIILFSMNSFLRAIRSLSEDSTKESLSGQHSVEAKSTGTSSTVLGSSEIERGFIFRLSASQFKWLKLLVLFSVAMAVMIPFGGKATHFILFSLWLNELLNCSFFIAIISLDWRGRGDNILAEKSSHDDLLLDADVAPKFNHFGYEQVFQIMTSSEITIIIVASYLLLCNMRFSLAQSSSSLFRKLLSHAWSQYTSLRSPQPKVGLDLHFIAERAFSPDNSNVNKLQVVDLSIWSPVSVVQSESSRVLAELLNDKSDLMSSDFFYKVDFSYALQFAALIVLVLCCTLLGLQKLVASSETSKAGLFIDSRIEHVSDFLAAKKTDDAGIKSGPTKEVNLANLDQFHMKELYRNGHGLDIMRITTSKAPFIVSVGLDHKVFVWSPLVNPVPAPTKIPLERKFWPLSKVLLSNDGNLVAFFGKNGNISTWSRRDMKFIWEVKLKDLADSNVLKANLLEALFRKITVPAFKKKRLQNSTKQSEISVGKVKSVSSEYVPVVAGGLDTTYENPNKKTNEGDEMSELVFVTSMGLIYSIREDGVLAVERLTPSKHRLTSCKVLSSPRVNDRLVICDEAGDIYIATVVNNKWRPNKLKVNYDRILKPRSVTCELTNHSTSNNNVTGIMRETDNTIELVQFVGLLVRVLGKTADLIDAQTGTVIKRFKIDHFKPNTLRVFHDNPTHCKFCGSASVASFSIAYTDAVSDRVTMHTYKLESRTKTSICLRVERDLREIRCLGMESAVETVHYLYDIEDWCVTDSNMLIGIRKVPQMLESSKAGSSSMTRSLVHDGVALQQRKNSKQEFSDIHSGSHLIHNIWEGWTMSAGGKILFHKIPVGVTGLVTDRLGPLSKFGVKAVVVGFGNIMDMLYVGSEDLIFSTETSDSNKEETSLRFVNNRRDRFSHKRMPLNYGNLG